MTSENNFARVDVHVSNRPLSSIRAVPPSAINAATPVFELFLENSKSSVQTKLFQRRKNMLFLVNVREISPLVT